MEKILFFLRFLKENTKAFLFHGRIPAANKEILNKRIRICKKCTHFTGSQCKKCGCFVFLKARFLIAECPDSKWEL